VTPFFDDHAHPFPLAADRLSLSAITLDVRPGRSAAQRRVDGGPSRLLVEAIRVRLAALLHCLPDEVEEVRDARAADDWPGYVAMLFADADVAEMLLDGGPDRIDASRYQAVSGVATRTLFRIESVVDPLLERGAGADDVLRAVETEVANAARAGVAGLKTVLAYRTGLEVDPAVSVEEARRSVSEPVPVRRRAKALRDLVLLRTLDQAAQLGLPVQVHTGFGDSDLVLRAAEPILLDALLRSPAGTAASVVLIHGGFPWHEQVGYLASVRPRVWAEYSLANLMSPATTADRLLRLLDLAPTDRVVLGSDGHGSPETHWFASCVLRDAWRDVRQRLAGTVRPVWLDDVEDRIFATNARRLYRQA
jgi:predicted TIM-barrel fold metal-dependent hydrolase